MNSVRLSLSRQAALHLALRLNAALLMASSHGFSAFMTLDKRLVRTIIGFVMMLDSLVMAQLGRPLGDLGPGRRSEDAADNRRESQRIARRSEPERSSYPPQVARRGADQPWWSRDVEANADFARSNQSANARGDLIPSSQIIAMVGDEPILAGDLLGRINEALQQHVGKVPEEALEQQRRLLLAQLLPSSIEAKIVYLDFLRNIPAEQSAAIRASIYQQFDEKQLPELIKKAQVTNVVELEEKMRAVGASLDKTRRLFYEQAAAREMIRRRSDQPATITHAELLAYYQDHLDDFKIEGKARWEQLMTRVAPDASEAQKAAAYEKLARMGNAVIGGTPFHVVAQRDSDGVSAEVGGLYDWTVQGSLVSEVLDQAIFSLPIGLLSDVLTDDTGFHIVRVIERIDPGHTPFAESQKKIRELIENDRRELEIKQYIEELKARTFVRNDLPLPQANPAD